MSILYSFRRKTKFWDSWSSEIQMPGHLLDTDPLKSWTAGHRKQSLQTSSKGSNFKVQNAPFLLKVLNAISTLS